ncbi:MAG TPA: TIGR03619 family F420-dependent LLM class oxidoreductase, partial [Acidimicrobiales bacterium]|nr:TIGR03619 family F420-dependent LLM class oxidoreductase [Acidimicrobiales bacterium]
MHLGISVFAIPPEWYSELGRRADELGFDSFWVAEHLVTPLEYDSRYPYSDRGVPNYDIDAPLSDPLVALASVAAVTTRIGLGTGVYILPLRSAMITARACTTLQNISHGRFTLGIGTGWMREEFEAAGEDFGDRGARTDDIIVVLRKVWSGRPAEHASRFQTFGPLVLPPAPAAPIPILASGLARPTLRRAARLDGWYGPPEVPLEVTAAARDTIERERDLIGASGPFTYYARLNQGT